MLIYLQYEITWTIRKRCDLEKFCSILVPCNSQYKIIKFFFTELKKNIQMFFK
mgnify:CR=1 FL=1